MAGIYIHIPFCVTRCAYCDFFSTTQLDKREAYIRAVQKELRMRSNYLPHDSIIRSVYFGGGTPSLLRGEDISALLQQIADLYPLSEEAEITLEANPSDLSESYLNTLSETGVNRLSIGIQSFNDGLLHLMQRRHDALTAKLCVKMAKVYGFRNISIDLIYGLPAQTLTQWQDDLSDAVSLDVQHISTYCLTYEKQTQFGKMIAEGKLKETDEDLANRMYETANQVLTSAGFRHYEVSNFCRSGYQSRHNSSYWNNVPYLGLGAGAHSYDGMSRQWNVAHLQQYMEAIRMGVLPYEREVLSKTDLYNERVMLSLRTDNGLALAELSEYERTYCLQQAANDIQRGLLVLTKDGRLVATLGGTELLNRIIENLIIV